MKFPEALIKMAEGIKQAGGTPVLVGGAVRDHFLGRESHDLDVEIFGLSNERMVSVLQKFGKVSVVGKTFGVFKVTVDGRNFDCSLPRKDSKIGAGHKGFDIETDPAMSFKEAASRRDFTINAMGINILTGEVIDHFNGINDLKNRVLRVVDSQTFVEDPLRVLRAVQFAARFELKATNDSLQVFKSIVDSLKELPRERIFEEFKKLLLKSEKPSIGLELADKIGVVRELFPELNALHNVQQDPEWHPEGDVWVHTMRVIDSAVHYRKSNEFRDLCLMFAALCHDFGKPETTAFTKEKWRSLKHTEAGVEPTSCFMEKLTNETRLLETVKVLVKKHLTPSHLFNASQVSDGAIRRLSLKVDIPLLIDVATADYFGCLHDRAKSGRFPAGEWLMERFKNLQLEAAQKIQPLLMGRHLIELGLTPSPEFGLILREAFELQLDDGLRSLDHAMEWAKKRIDKLKK